MALILIRSVIILTISACVGGAATHLSVYWKCDILEIKLNIQDRRSAKQSQISLIDLENKYIDK